MENNNEVLLKVDHLCQYFRLGRQDLKAVEDVSFDIKKGEAFGLVGESGCGKTTTGRTIIRLYDATSGNVYFKGKRICAGTRSYYDAIRNAKANYKVSKHALMQDSKLYPTNAQKNAERLAELKIELDECIAKNRVLIAEAKHDHRCVNREYGQQLAQQCREKYEPMIDAAASDEERQALIHEYRSELRIAKNTKLTTQIQMIFQDPIASLDPRMTVRDIIAEGLIINGITDKELINEKVYKMLELVGLVREHADRYPHEFSGGQRQRIGIARAVIMEPEMIIADEPVSALDVSIQAQVVNLLNDLRERLGLTVLFIAHDLSVVKYFSDRIGVMYFGRMVELADSDELFKNPMHPYTKSLLSAIPLPDPVYEKQRTRVIYNPIAEHDYSQDKPSFREITPGHFVYCNDAEEASYKQSVK